MNRRPANDAEVPVGEGDVEPEERREDHHGDGEQHRGQHEQRALAGSPRISTWPAPSATAQSDDRHRAPAAKSSKPSEVDAGRVEDSGPERRPAGQAKRAGRAAVPPIRCRRGRSPTSDAVSMLAASQRCDIRRIEAARRRASRTKVGWRRVKPPAAAMLVGPAGCSYMPSEAL